MKKIHEILENKSFAFTLSTNYTKADAYFVLLWAKSLVFGTRVDDIFISWSDMC